MIKNRNGTEKENQKNRDVISLFFLLNESELFMTLDGVGHAFKFNAIKS